MADRNIGNGNNGSNNTGNYNIGNNNTGDYNQGNNNVGNHNRGDDLIGDHLVSPSLTLATTTLSASDEISPTTVRELVTKATNIHGETVPLSDLHFAKVDTFSRTVDLKTVEYTVKLSPTKQPVLVELRFGSRYYNEHDFGKGAQTIVTVIVQNH